MVYNMYIMKNIILIYNNEVITTKILESLLKKIEDVEIIDIFDEDELGKIFVAKKDKIKIIFIKDKLYTTKLNTVFAGLLRPILITSELDIKYLSMNIQGILEYPFTIEKIRNILDI